ncbi:MAG: DivIVA domain-containing protein [Oscillospiraceae bacterium]|nr:DivIVA domain-containing protein [Oscillospiraceae bacterium]
MLKAQDIRVVTFDKGMRGYNTEDVDAFLAQVADQVETMEREKAEIEKKLYMLAEKVAEYRKDENNLKAALLNAQRLGENVIQEANQRAAQILREADIKAQAVCEQTTQRLEEEKLELARLQEEVGRFKNNILALYRQHIESLSTLPEPPAPPVQEEPAAPAEEPQADLFAAAGAEA